MAGASLTGGAGWVFTPTNGFPVSSVYVYCEGGSSSQTVTTANSDGTFSGTLDSSQCPNGSGSLYAVASWTDQFGTAHSWTTPALPVTIQNTPAPPSVSVYTGGQQYFNPSDQSGQDNTATVYFCVSGASPNLTATVTNSDGATVKTIETGVNANTNGCYYTNYVTWDGTNDDGHTVPDGVYTLTITATDSYGQTTSTTTQLGVESPDAHPGHCPNRPRARHWPAAWVGYHSHERLPSLLRLRLLRGRRVLAHSQHG